MAAVRLGEEAYITFAPPWSKRMFKMGRLGFPPGKVPSHLYPYLFKKGEIKPIADECRAEGKAGAALVECIYRKVGIKRKKG